MKTPEKTDYPQGVRQVLSILDECQAVYQLRSFDEPAHRASEAAALLACPLGAIVKSLVFQTVSTGEILLVLVSGENRVDLELLSGFVGEPVRPASPKDVQKTTGYSIGAVPPFGMKGEYPVFIDEDLMKHHLVWSSAGAVNILLGISPENLKRLSGGPILALKCRYET
jgi:Cys-tRNA(Pro) deacylase